MLCNNHRSHIILLCSNKIYSTHKCHHHYINIINIWDNLTKMVLYNCDFCEQMVHTDYSVYGPTAVLKWRADLNFSVKDASFLFLPVRFMIQFSGSLCFILWSEKFELQVWISWVWKAQRHFHHVHLLWNQRSAVMTTDVEAPEEVVEVEPLVNKQQTDNDVTYLSL